MKHITVTLTEKSIRDAIKQLNSYKQSIITMTDKWLEYIGNFIIDRARYYIESSDIGTVVKDKLKSSFHCEVSNNVARITNNLNLVRRVRDKLEKVPVAVLVEFGVGAVGASEKHPKAESAGYEYNVPSPSKYAGQHHDDDTWRFISYDSEELDLPIGSYESWDMASGANKIITRGAKGVHYAYNALVDARVELSKPNGEFAKEWKRLEGIYLS